MSDSGLDSFDLREASDDILGHLHGLEVDLDAERAPHDPPRTVEQYIAAVRSTPRFIEERALVVRSEDGTIAGAAECVAVHDEETRHAQLSLVVRRDARLRGYGRTLLTAALDVIDGWHRSPILGVTDASIPAGAAFARHIGAGPVNVSHVNRLALDRVDRGLVSGWVAECPQRARGYSLISLDAPLPNEMLPEVAELLDVMNDAPGGSADTAERHVTPEELRGWEQQDRSTGRVRWWLFARHDTTGRLVGLTEVAWNPSRGRVVQQANTGVIAAHRGHALGKWLKAAMLERILRECQGAVEIRTSNADSNAAMLAINQQLGFAPYLEQTTWQIDSSALRVYLEATTGSTALG